MMLTVTDLTLTRLEVTLLFYKKQIIGTNCYLKKHYYTNEVAETIIKHWLKSLERLAVVLIKFHRHHADNF